MDIHGLIFIFFYIMSSSYGIFKEFDDFLFIIVPEKPHWVGAMYVRL